MKRFRSSPRSNRKGSTLAEMCVVLAVISIVTLAVVSFTTMVSARGSVSAAKLKMMEDRRLTRVVLESWLDTLTEANATITTDENGILAFVSGNVYTVSLQENQLIATVPSGDTLTCPISTLTRLTFDRMTNAGGDALYICTAEYEIPDPNGGTLQRSFTFAIDPHIGDVYEEVGA